VKAHLLYPDQDFDFQAPLPPGHDDLAADLELTTPLAAMAAGDDFLYDVSARVLMASLTDAEAIRYRQQVLADCITEPGVIRQIYAIATGALRDRRKQWGFLGSQNPSHILSSAIRQLEVLIARLRELRQVADEHAGRFSSAGLTTLLRAVRHELDDDYFDTLRRHLRQLQFRDGVPMSAELDRDNSGINYVLLSRGSRRSWKERIRIEPRSVYSFTIPPRDEAGAQTLEAMTSRGLNLVANAAAQSADHVTSFFTMSVLLPGSAGRQPRAAGRPRRRQRRERRRQASGDHYRR
jgi:hypothetical protein